ncbi:Outer membrane efflux protein [Rosistilla carotiformis]|uniref:Outer membrane efflux protein n=1 Tax=Rosistilla carotiformis TaxID=2528017 RepID=A0A518JP16_9BACT|nr:TolC family protein [Rosistilla carotiformis]QDV67273.1 Outer membrane efflux protein [Rosistilla carotiformis]
MIDHHSTCVTQSHPPTAHRQMLVWGWAIVTIALCAAGCRTLEQTPQTICNDTTAVDAVMCRVDSGNAGSVASTEDQRPLTLEDFQSGSEIHYWELTLEEAISTALTNTQVLRDLGATILRSPDLMMTEQSRPLQQTDPRFGMEGALSAFDAQLDILATFQNNDRRFNNRFFGGGSNVFTQDRHDYIAQLSKRSATGAEFALRSISDYDANNATGNITPSAWQQQFEGEVRQPLLQGGGLTFNRIAGPGSVPGVYNGVLIAKVNSDINDLEFELALRRFVSDVTNAYWDLYFAYRDFDAKHFALEKSRETWLNYEAQKVANRRSGAAEALAREQFFRFQSELQDAIAGKATQRTESGSGTQGGVFAGVGGVQAAERKLRLMIGLPQRGEQLLRPSDEPIAAPIRFDWDSIAAEALRDRAELRKQRMVVERRRLEWIAAKNFLLPQLDMIGRYRYRGLDKNWIGDDSAFRDLGSGNFQEWEAGFELSLPVGFRQAHAAVQNARLHLAREQAVLTEQSRRVTHDLAAMVAEADRAFQQTQTNMNRFLAAADAVEALEANRRAGLPVNLEQLLDAQRRLSDAQTLYFTAKTEYAIALKNIEFEKGSLLRSSRLYLASNQ